MAQIKTFQAGKYSDYSQRMLNEIVRSGEGLSVAPGTEG